LYTAALQERQHISAGHSKTNRNAAIKFDFALQSGEQEEDRISPSPSAVATIEAQKLFDSCCGKVGNMEQRIKFRLGLVVGLITFTKVRLGRYAPMTMN
jgi:hypothetical protein